MFDLQDEECRPARVLRRVWDNLGAAEAAGDRKSAYFKRNLRVIAAGGDGTVAWILGTIRQVHNPNPKCDANPKPSPKQDNERLLEQCARDQHADCQRHGGVATRGSICAIDNFHARPVMLRSCNTHLILLHVQLKLEPPPRVAVLPLGTGNDLSLSFGWGNAFLPSWLRNFGSVYNMLRRVADAQPRELDCWRITMSAGDAPLLLWDA